MALAVASYTWLTPSIQTMKTIELGWIAYLLARNSLLVVFVYGLLEFRLYVKRVQGNRFKFNGKWPSESSSHVFMFKIRTFVSGVPIWTAYEVGGLWAIANGYGPFTTFAQNPIWLLAFGFVLPLWHEFHFYCTHRLIHTFVLYKYTHSDHHNSVNPSPWSSLSMHPIEHLLCWSDCLIHFVLPSHPLLFLYNLQITSTGAVVGHIGFDKLEVGDEGLVNSNVYVHYLHHKHFEVNYAYGATALDKLFGTWHDGSKEAQAQIEERFEKKIARMNARL
jgi:sterol desaturase/sphingolipid hydroxylase (fatty acid hydroxylase superfamily)